MKASIKSIDLIDYDSWGYWPDDIEDFCVAAEALIGLEEGKGADIFSFDICTPKWFGQNILRDIAFARGTLFVRQYDEQLIKKHIFEIVQTVEGQSWQEIVEKLSLFMRWEYEDYRVA